MAKILSTRRLCHALEALMVVSMLALPAVLAADEPEFIRVRSTDIAIARLIELAATRSDTFRHLVASIQASNGIVHVEPGECGHGTRACLKVWMAVGGSTRFLRVVVNPKRASSEVDLVGSIGHELQHTVEALSEPNTVNGFQLYNFFSRTGFAADTRFETLEAIQAGDAVRRELGGQRLR
jgi:hypothetical protein